MTVRLDGKVVLVTGATAGIGRALVEVLVARGACVVGMARREEQGAELSRALDGGDGRFVFVQGDVTSRADCGRVVAAATETFGRLDVLVNNAANLLPARRVEDIDDDAWQAVANPTLMGVLNMTRAVLPVMQGQRSGSILSVSSGNSEQALADTGAYAISKAAVNHLMRVVAVENLATGVRANTVIVGAVDTDMGQQTMLAMGQAVRGSDWVPEPPPTDAPPSPLFIPASNIGRAIALLCSDDACEINGATIAVDRAFSAGAVNSMMFHMAAAQLLPT